MVGGSPMKKQTILSPPSKPKSIGAIALIALGITLVPTGFFMRDFILNELDKGIADEISIAGPHDSDYNEFISNNYTGAIPMYRKFYMWNLTNPSEFFEGIKPVFDEVGPYTFREFTTKYHVNYSTNLEEVSYKQYSTYIFEPNLSDPSCNLDDEITNINPAYLGVLEQAGSEANLIKVMFPTILSEVKALFEQEISITLNELLTNQGIYNMLVGTLNDTLGELFSGILSEEAINMTATWIVDFITTYIVPLQDLVEFMVDAMPSAEEIFFAEWATDYFPEVQVDVSILFSHILDVINDLVDFIVDLIFFWDVLHLFDAIKDALKEELMNMFETVFTDSPFAEAVAELFENLIRELGAEIVDEKGSESGVGVEIDGRDPYNYPGPQADLNITNYYKNGESGITQEQCQALWDPNNPNSLLGMKVSVNPIWFEALVGYEESRFFIMDTFGLNEIQLDLILSWIDASLNGWLKNICEYTIKEWNSGLITSRTVEEWLFTAIDNLVNEQDPNQAKVAFFANCISEEEAEAEGIKSVTVNTGNNDISKVCEITKYDGESIITIWKENELVQGTGGTQFCPGVSKSDKLYVFVSDLLRSVELFYTNTTSRYNIELLRYELSENTFGINTNYYQTIKGLANVSLIQGIPLFFSKPHFLNGNDYLIHSIDGLNPNKLHHDTYLDVEPITGAVMNAAERFQINLMVNKTDIWYSNCREGFMPIFWLEFGGQIDEDLAQDFKKLVYGTQNLSKVLHQGILGLGALLVIPGVIFTTTQNRKRINTKKQKLTLGAKTPKLHKQEPSKLQNSEPSITPSNKNQNLLSNEIPDSLDEKSPTTSIEEKPEFQDGKG